MSSGAFLAITVAVFGTLAGCGAAMPTAMGEPETPVPQVLLTGVVQFEARSPTPTGASRAREVRPARRVDFDVRDAADQILATGATSEDGRFSVQVPVTARAVVIFARSRDGDRATWVSPDPQGRAVHQFRAPLMSFERPLTLLATDDAPEGPAGALHILDTLQRGYAQAERWSGARLPSLFVYWRRGGTTQWSYYRGERPPRSGQFALELLGGQPGQQSTTDTDDHDETIILHEFGHFAMDRLTGDSSPGGDHPAGALIDPGLAWEEGRATWFSLSALGVHEYRDTIGLEGQGSLRVDHDLERGLPGPRGVGCEQSTSSVLLDLADGGTGPDALADFDADGVSLGPAVVLREMMELARQDGVFPNLSVYLQHIVRRGLVDTLTLKRMLIATGQPTSLLPVDPAFAWPPVLELDRPQNGKIDGLTNPAPSGGPARPQNGFDALRHFRVYVPQRGFLFLSLRIFGSGRVVDHQDLDLELRSIRADLIDRAATEAQTETLGRLVEPGWYVVYVRDGGAGNRAGFEVTARFRGQP